MISQASCCAVWSHPRHSTDQSGGVCCSVAGRAAAGIPFRALFERGNPSFPRSAVGVKCCSLGAYGEVALSGEEAESCRASAVIRVNLNAPLGN